jgi:PAS domain S-box-containing protein
MNPLGSVQSSSAADSTGGLSVAREHAERYVQDGRSAKPSANPEVDAQVRQLLETLPGMISITSADGQLEYVNHELLELAGVPFDEIAGTQWVNVLHPDDARGALEEWARRTSAGLPFQYYYRVRTRDGSYRWCQSLAKPIFNNTGEIAKFYCYTSDVDAVGHPDESLLDSEQALRLLMDSVPTLVWGFGVRGDALAPAAARGASSFAFDIKTRILDLALLAAVAFEQLQLISASRLAGDALSMARANGMNETTVAGCAATVLAQVQYELGDLDRAENLIAGHLSVIRTSCAPDVVTKAYTILSRVAFHRSRYDQASALLSEGRAVGEFRSCPLIVLTMMAERVRLWISTHEIARAQKEFLAMRRYESNLHSPDRHVGKEIGQICDLTRWRLAIAGGHAADAVLPLRVMCHAARSAQRRHAEFTLNLELSGALDMSGERESAERLLRRALQRSERYGLFQCWADGGSACCTVLWRLAGQFSHGASPRMAVPNSYLLSLLAHGKAYDRIHHHAKASKDRTTVPLSPREREVLALVAKGQSNKRVAQTLNVTQETVKSHLKRAFHKLESKTRAEAVARATELGFLTSAAASFRSY